MRRLAHMLSAVLLGGWLLMYPPIVLQPDGTASVDRDAPVSRWKQFGAYDSVRACQDMCNQMGTGSDKSEKEWSDTFQKDWNVKREVSDSHARALADSASACRCVPAEHIYPPKGCTK